ncbi:protein NDR1-like [Punica granatum]|uniref:Protein NDR1-like n=2 Tax=Punica granatum TaxID=22663 RepID=A0A6P8DEN9_PUNGR|nr:protein NDR1-like [Punica granatum]
MTLLRHHLIMAFTCKMKCPFSFSPDDTACQVLLWVLKALALSGLIVLSAWLASIPKKPNAAVSALSIPATALHLEINGTSVTSAEGGNSNDTITYALEIENPNKDSGIYYDDIAVTIYVGNDKVSETTMPAFYQGMGKTKKVNDNVNADLGVMRAHSGEFSMAKAELKVTLVTRIQYKTWGKKSKHHDLRVQGLIPVGSDGKMRGKKKKIKLHHCSNKKWRRIKLD